MGLGCLWGGWESVTVGNRNTLWHCFPNLIHSNVGQIVALLNLHRQVHQEYQLLICRTALSMSKKVNSAKDIIDLAIHSF